MWKKVNTGTTTTGTNAGAAIGAGITRMILRHQTNYKLAVRGSESGYLVVNEALSDANIEAIIDAFSGADADRLALLEETHGIIWEVESTQWAILTPSEDDKFIGSLVLSEIDRVGALETRDA